MLTEVLPAGVFAYLLVFVRLGAALMLIPGIGETYIPTRVRLAFAAALTLATAPLLIGGLPAAPEAPLRLLLLIGGEVLIGVMIGMAARFAITGLHVAGTVIAFQSGLGFALSVDPTQGTQGALVATFLNLLGLVLIFATNLHHLVLQALVDSYVLFIPGQVPPVGDFAALVVRYLAGSFALGIQIAAPFIVYGLVFYAGLGLIARLMPQLQIFFIAMPMQVFLGLTVLAIIIAPAMLWFLTYFESTMAELLAR